MSALLSELLFTFQRLNWISVLDIFLVTFIFFTVLIMVRDTQAVVLLRGVILLVILLTVLTSVVNLPAFSWLLQTAVPTMVLAIPVIFAPEIRRALERIGRAGSSTTLPFRQRSSTNRVMQQTIGAVVTAAATLSSRRHGALIILQRGDYLEEYIETGVYLNATVTPELLLQIFYPNTPLHDGAVIISDNKVTAAACVMPLSSSGVLESTPEHKMGLRHRASMGISEASDAIAVVVSEETGYITIAHNGRMIRNLDADRLENLLLAFYRPVQIPSSPLKFVKNLFRRSRSVFRED